MQINFIMSDMKILVLTLISFYDNGTELMGRIIDMRIIDAPLYITTTTILYSVHSFIIILYIIILLYFIIYYRAQKMDSGLLVEGGGADIYFIKATLEKETNYIERRRRDSCILHGHCSAFIIT